MRCLAVIFEFLRIFYDSWEAEMAEALGAERA